MSRTIYLNIESATRFSPGCWGGRRARRAALGAMRHARSTVMLVVLLGLPTREIRLPSAFFGRYTSISKRLNRSLAHLSVSTYHCSPDGYPRQTTIGMEYRNGIRNAFRNRRMSKPSMGHEANPFEVAASSSSCRQKNHEVSRAVSWLDD